MLIIRIFKTIVPDPIIFLSVFLITAIGVLTIQGASGEHFSNFSQVTRNQIFFVVLGFLVMITVSYLPVDILEALTPLIYIAGIAILLLVLLLGDESFGAQRWLSLGPIRFQPMEITKITTMLMLAYIASRNLPHFGPLLINAIVLGIPTILILLQPDLGSTLVIVVSSFLVIVAWGTSVKMLTGLLVGGIGLLPILGALIPGYQLERIATFIDPTTDPLGAGYTAKQLDIALSKAQLFGVSFTSEESALDGISVRNSDFIFAQLLEFSSVAVGLVVVLLFALVVWRAILIRPEPTSEFQKLATLGLISLMTIQVVVHIGVNVRFLPTTGITMPLMSAGGSSLISMFILIGLLQSIMLNTRSSESVS